MFTAVKIGLAALILVVTPSLTSTTETYTVNDPDIFSGVVQPHIAEAATIENHPYKLTEDDIAGLVKKYAIPLHVKQKSMLDTIRCEAPRNKDGTFNPRGQSDIINEDGEREDSWGIAQINLPHHPEITKAEAQDPEFSISFMANEFSEGRADRWTCWRFLKRNGKI